MRSRRLKTALLGAVLVSTLTGGVTQAKAPPAVEAKFIVQSVPLAPFERSTTYVVAGERTLEGCAYTYPEFTVPADVDRWQIRDVGIDPKRCLKLVEEGVPTVEDVSEADASVTAVIASATVALLAH